MIVCLVALSGLPDPEWELSPQASEDILKRLNKASKREDLTFSADIPPLLGYSGFTIHEGKELCAYVFNGLIHDAKAKCVRSDDDLEKDLLALAPLNLMKHIPGFEFSKLKKQVEDSLQVSFFLSFFLILLSPLF